MNNKILISLLLIINLSISGWAQKKYSIDASKTSIPLEKGHLKMGNPGPLGKEIEVNNLFMTIGGKAVLPVMGEMHFSRVRPDQWEDCILKMKAAGINIISTYLFWNHHEEIEGQFVWDGDKDLRSFIKRCRAHGMFVYPRIGPWSHGEARNGGTPDWILRKKNIENRSNDIIYQKYVARYFKEIAAQLDGLYYKDGGNVIGIQLENEYWYAKKGEPHIQWLKNTAKEYGMDVPFYTVTGWGGGSVPPLEVIPLWGGYADEPWIESVHKNVLAFYFKFDSFRDSKHIGNDHIDHKEEYMTYARYPYFTCEMGVGIPQMYHRRSVLSPIDGYGMMIAKLGSGSNLLGYYMFAGGTNPRGELHPNEEEQEETGYWSRTPAKSYDFQAAIKESGELAPSYHQVKKLHYFVNDFGEKLAPMLPTLAKNDDDDLQLAVRSDKKAGYLFGLNYCRYMPKPERKDVLFSIKLDGETLQFPQSGVNIPDSTIFIWPMNMDMEGALLKYATAQLLCVADDTYIFFQNKTITPELAFDNTTVADIQTAKGTVSKKGKMIVVLDIKPGKDCLITLTLANGKQQNLIVLTEEEATNSWLLDRNGKKEFYVSIANMYAKHDDVLAFSSENSIVVNKLQNGKFAAYTYTTTLSDNKLKLTERQMFTDVKWLETANFKDLPVYQERYHRFFFKEFSLDNPSDFRKVTLYIYPETASKLSINYKWIKQDIVPNQLNAVDVTGYVSKGENMLFVAFPYIEGKAKFAARVIAEYSNYDRVEFATDESWLSTDMYTNPSAIRAYNRPEKPIVIDAPDFAKTLMPHSFGEWDIELPYGSFDGLSALYSHISYTGDRAAIYNGHILCWDDFNFNVPWQIGWQRMIPSKNGGNLRLVIYPLSKETKMFFDIMPKADEYGMTHVKGMTTIGENCFTIK
jgi:hypothetical protein